MSCSSKVQTLTWILRCLCLAHLQVRGYGGQDLFSTAGLDGLGIFPAQLALLTTTALANVVHARRHACLTWRQMGLETKHVEPKKTKLLQS